jgi:ribosomal protein S18 acetylase RimI-like enzyme
MTSVRRRVAVARRTATATDIPFLRSLFADAHLELTVLPTDTRYVLIDMRFRAERRQHALNHPRAAHEILVVNGTDVGRVLVDRTAETIHVVDISVGLGHRREGIAAEVLDEIVSDADRDTRPVQVTVWAGNTAATELLAAAGFESVADEGGYLTLHRAAHDAGAVAER